MTAKFNSVELIFGIVIFSAIFSFLGYRVGQKSIDMEGLLAYINTQVSNICVVQK